MTDEDIARLKELHARSTLGVLRQGNGEDAGLGTVFYKYEDGGSYVVSFGLDPVDAELIVAAVNALPDLLAIADEARAQSKSILRQTGAAIGVEPGAAVRHLIADRDAVAAERDEARRIAEMYSADISHANVRTSEARADLVRVTEERDIARAEVGARLAREITSTPG